MKDLKAIRGRNHILSLIEEGEHVHQDFKFAISDARKIARSISAFANNDGGRLLIGVKDNGVPAGIRNEEDVYMIETAAETFCSPPVKVEMKAYNVDSNVVVLKAEIPRALRPPVYVKEQGGVLKAYYRVKDENIAAPEILIRAWECYAQPDGALMQFDEQHRQLIDIIRREGSVTFERFVLTSHISRSRALDVVGRLLASSVLALSHNGAEFVLTIDV